MIYLPDRRDEAVECPQYTRNFGTLQYCIGTIGEISLERISGKQALAHLLESAIMLLPVSIPLGLRTYRRCEWHGRRQLSERSRLRHT